MSRLLILLTLLILELHVCHGMWWFPNWFWKKPVCFSNPPIGCFPTTYPYNNSGEAEPWGPGRQQIRFQMRKHDEARAIFSHMSSKDFLRQFYNPYGKTVVIVHGWLESPMGSWVDDYFFEISRREENLNLLALDWSQGASELVYEQAVANARVAGAVLALVLREMVELGGTPASFHLIGFSLGAHVAGFAGERVQGLGRITGLDPAGPNYHYTSPAARLDPTDAKIVDVYHTDITPSTGAGLETPVGTVDFYLNGGKDQPGCDNRMFHRMSAAVRHGMNTRSSAWRNVVACSHNRAHVFFASTMRTGCIFHLETCSSLYNMEIGNCQPCSGATCVTVGYNYIPSRDTLATGRIINVKTSERWPFCRDAYSTP